MAAVLPEAFRQAAKINLENARRSFDTLMVASEKVWSVEATLLPAQSGMAALIHEMSRLARNNVDANFDAAQKLIDAENFEEGYRLCVEHMQERLTAFTRQLQEVQSFAPDKAAPETEDRPRQTSVRPESVPESVYEQTTTSPNHATEVTPAPKGKRREVSRSRQTKAHTLPHGAANGPTKARTGATRAITPRVSETKESSRKVSPKGGKRKSSRKQQRKA